MQIEAEIDEENASTMLLHVLFHSTEELVEEVSRRSCDVPSPVEPPFLRNS